MDCISDWTELNVGKRSMNSVNICGPLHQNFYQLQILIFNSQGQWVVNMTFTGKGNIHIRALFD